MSQILTGYLRITSPRLANAVVRLLFVCLFRLVYITNMNNYAHTEV